MKIKDLYNKQMDIWKKENEYYFGISPLSDWSNPEIVKEHLSDVADRLWNNGTNKLKELLENRKNRHQDKLIEGTYELEFDPFYEVIDLYASFKLEDEHLTKRAPIAKLPYPKDITWMLHSTEYVARISAIKEFSLEKHGNLVSYGRVWSYNINEKKFTLNSRIKHEIKPFEQLSNHNRNMLISLLKLKGINELTEDNFEYSLTLLPEFELNSIINYRFGYLDEFFSLVERTNRFANPLSKTPISLNIVKLFLSKQSTNIADDNLLSNLILSQNTIFALENARTIIYKSIYNSTSAFNFKDGVRLFDSFKTSTNKSAGRSRLILDNVEIRNGMLWNQDTDGNLHNMFDLAFNKNIKIGPNLSCISYSRFSYNDEAKRIMMTAKLRAQSIKVKGEENSFTHEIAARVIFGDFQGYNFGDSIIISESFAKKLESSKIETRTISIPKALEMMKEKYKIGDFISSDDFSFAMGSSKFRNYRNIKILDLDFEKETIKYSATIPFSVGDKLTNFHGSKGIVSLILPDDKMPKLVNDIKRPDGTYFEKGPFEVILSALSVFKRKSLGQLFEAWAEAMNIEDVNNIQEAKEKYSYELKYFSENSIIKFDGNMDGIEEITHHPIGINHMIRLDHDASGKQSFSNISSNNIWMLKFGEMELLNLASRGLYDIISELDIRSVTKYFNAKEKIFKMQKDRILENETANDTSFFRMLQVLGYKIELENEKEIEEKKKSIDYSGKEGVIILNREKDIFEEDI